MTEARNHAAEGDERIRTAVCDGTNDPAYEVAAEAVRMALTTKVSAPMVASALEGLDALVEIARAAHAWANAESSDEYAARLRTLRAALTSPEART